MDEWTTHLKAIWGLIILVVAGMSGVLTFFLVRLTNKTFRKAMEDAGKASIEAYKDAVDAQRTLAVQLSEVHLATVTRMETLLKAMTEERDDYRQKLHDANNRAQALESRPNVDHVYSAQQEFFAKIISIMERQELALKAIQEAILRNGK